MTWGKMRPLEVFPPHQTYGPTFSLVLILSTQFITFSFIFMLIFDDLLFIFKHTLEMPRSLNTSVEQVPWT